MDSDWMAEVASCLGRSIAAHRRGMPSKLNPSRESIKQHLVEARRLRQEAHDLDPEHKCWAWEAEDKETGPNVNTHKALMAFYAQVLD